MKTELLIIKCQNGYIREKDGDYQIVSLDKASVYPWDQLTRAKKHLAGALAGGLTPASLKKLVLTQEDLDEADLNRVATPGN